jgi:hypothetical protein
MKPILFNTEMVRKILSGEKTVTRRVVKPAHLRCLDSPYRKEHPEVQEKQILEKLCEPPYKEGDVLYVRETWTKLFFADADGYTHYDQPMYYFAADGVPDITLVDEDGFELDDQRIRWRPSIHMPKEAARIFLRVTGVRVERLQEAFFEPICPILEVHAEGIDIGDHCRDSIDHYGTPCCVDTVDEDGSDLYDGECGMLDDPRDDFARLWDSTIAPEKREIYGWAANPWVWVIEFERCEKPKEGVS